MTRHRHATNDRVHRYTKRLYQLGDSAIPFDLFVRYSAYLTFAMLIVPVMLLALLPLGPLVIFSLFGVGARLRLRKPEQYLTPRMLLTGAAAGVAVWAVMGADWVFGYNPMGISRTLIYSVMLSLLWTSTVVDAMGDRTISSAVSLWRVEIRAWWQQKRDMARAPKPVLISTSHVKIYDTPLETLS